ncbi:hypothetical protein [Streptomyces dysideae]|uniref:Uncharacterized protein n=1 Tax=Streptomyces dysideae TaxID=909626 RepID=A0A101UUG9_9ACTN|nr:hypothetical protein [Streptomyces dysideae]KUO17094.1 hypothetical protein AQJ91_32925 [Streptomyces dysideae]
MGDGERDALDPVDGVVHADLVNGPTLQPGRANSDEGGRFPPFGFRIMSIRMRGVQVLGSGA